MTSNHDRNRSDQREAKAWSKFTGTNYTAALRQVQSPLTQGILGEPLSARHLIDTLENHDFIGGTGADFVLGHSGFYADDPFTFDGQEDLVHLVLIGEVLSMFSPTTEHRSQWVSSYSLKHLVEEFLGPHCSYVSNGQVILVAAALGLPMFESENSGPNLRIGIPELEYSYARAMVQPGRTKPKSHHNRPPGFEYLQQALQSPSIAEHLAERWTPTPAATVKNEFHDWLLKQDDTDDHTGKVVRDYKFGIEDHTHGIAQQPSDLIDILDGYGAMPEFYIAADELIGQWQELSR